MDPERYAEAAEKLEADYLAGSMSADEYMRRRRELEDGTDPESTPAPMPPLSAADAQPVHLGADPTTGAPLASWGRRAAGWFVDLVVYFAAIAATVVISLASEDAETGEVSDAVAVLILVVWFLGPTLYAWLMVGRWGQTLGKMAVGIRVVRSDDAGRASYLRALGRAASVWVLGLLFFPILLAYLWPLWDRRNQTLYDKMAGTIVVRDAPG